MALVATPHQDPGTVVIVDPAIIAIVQIDGTGSSCEMVSIGWRSFMKQLRISVIAMTCMICLLSSAALPANAKSTKASSKDKAPKKQEAPATTAAASPDSTLRGFHVYIPATAGFAGLLHPNLTQLPVSSVDGNGVVTIDPSHVLLKRGEGYQLKPALSIGLLWWYQSTKSWYGAGIGTHVVFIPTSDGTSPAPAVTLHVGERKNHIYVGALFAPKDEIQFPESARQIIVSADKIPDYATHNTGRGLQLYFGIVILGQSLTSPGTTESQAKKN